MALLLGPSGVGLVGLYLSATSVVGTLAGLGIGNSGVREVAEAHGSGDAERVACTVKTLRRVCWVTGFFGWLATCALAYPLSLWTFGSGEKTISLTVLGFTLLLGAISAGQTALLQGTRRIGHLARLNVIGVIVGTIIAVGLYAWLGERGIVPVLIATGITNLGASWWFARRVPVADIPMSWCQTWQNSKRLIRLGLAFMWSGLLTAAVALAIRALIVRKLGLDANGIYQAAWGISGMFAGFILGAMGTDFYPRLAAVASDPLKSNRLVNEQTEIGILLALPGLLGTLAFAPWVIRVFYSAKFLAGATLLPWFVLGIFGQVISWPMGFALVAKGAARWYALVETCANIFRLVLSIILLDWLGLPGTALAVALLYIEHTALLFVICRRMTAFKWLSPCLKLIAASGVAVLAAFAVQKWIPGELGLAAGALLTLASALFSLRGITSRLGPEHRISRFVTALPVVGRLLTGLRAV